MKKYKSIYSLDGLLIKKKSLDVIKIINVLKLFSSLRFFRLDYYPFDYNKYLLFYNDLVKYTMYYNYAKFFDAVFIYFFKIFNKNKILKDKLGFEIQNFLILYHQDILIILKKVYFNRFKLFTKLKFKFKRLKKIFYLVKFKFGKRVDIKKSKKRIIHEDIRMKFFTNLLKNNKNLKIIYNYVRNRFKKSLKKKFKYRKKKKINTTKVLRKKFSNYLVFKKIRKKKKLLYKKLRINFKGNFLERNESANKLVKDIFKDKSKRKLRLLLNQRKKKFWKKLFLIRKFKRRFFRRRNKRTGILHFRMYYSNYYITLTDLSHNVIFSCSAGSVSDTNNKKTKMSNVVALPIFFRIIFFLRAFKIRNLKFVFRNKIDKIFFNALRFFKKRGYKIKSLSFVRRAPHHLGQRKQKPRRI